jgi:hypothetical protein
MLSTSALQQLGKLVNPATSKAEVDLDGAQVTIDMLNMLREKTRGNLSRDEEKMLGELVSSLQMNYVETARSQTDAGKKASPPGPAPSEPAAGETPDSTPPDAGKPGRDPKFHKSYGS